MLFSFFPCVSNDIAFESVACDCYAAYKAIFMPYNEQLPEIAGITGCIAIQIRTFHAEKNVHIIHIFQEIRPEISLKSLLLCICAHNAHGRIVHIGRFA
jgi:hypothetical protein